MAETETKAGRPEREGRKGVMTYLPDDVAIRLKVFAAQNRTTIQKIGEEAFADWLEKNEQSGGSSQGAASTKGGANKSPASKRPLKRQA